MSLLAPTGLAVGLARKDRASPHSAAIRPRGHRPPWVPRSGTAGGSGLGSTVMKPSSADSCAADGRVPAFRSCPRETSNPAAPSSGRGGPDATLRGLRAPCLSGDRPAPLHPALGDSSPLGRGGQAPTATSHRPGPSPLGLEDRPLHPRREGWPSTASTRSACGGRRACAGRPRAGASGPAHRVAASCYGRSARTRCGPWTSSSTRLPTAGG